MWDRRDAQDNKFEQFAEFSIDGSSPAPPVKFKQSSVLRVAYTTAILEYAHADHPLNWDYLSVPFDLAFDGKAGRPIAADEPVVASGIIDVGQYVHRA